VSLPARSRNSARRSAIEFDIPRLINILILLRALAAGFQVVELLAGHGYLVHPFLPPFNKHRTDSYGGSF
jgi:2,4-dienoyl-CoA reductase-like NADH-dependent reductase (Old Yellow Enzyme family)